VGSSKRWKQNGDEGNRLIVGRRERRRRRENTLLWRGCIQTVSLNPYRLLPSTSPCILYTSVGTFTNRREGKIQNRKRKFREREQEEGIRVGDSEEEKKSFISLCLPHSPSTRVMNRSSQFNGCLFLKTLGERERERECSMWRGMG
jgi:hypothetical protein